MKTIRPLSYLVLLLTIGALVGCTGLPTPTPIPIPETYTDPFAYCAAVGTADTPGPQYTGPKVPESVINGLKKALNMPADVPQEVLQNGSFWRCMNGQVYACFVGANLPCQEKANTNRTPDEAEKTFCRDNPNADVIPAAVTGHNTIYEWRCRNGEPEIVQQIAQPDERGFISHIWYKISPN
jgi:hypothetical protein